MPGCLKAYLGPDGKPRVFTLRELVSNGSNFGRKQKDWLPTLEAMHPWCVCDLVRLPDGWGFDEDNNMVPLPKVAPPPPELPSPDEGQQAA
jgi:hypothetical protein